MNKFELRKTSKDIRKTLDIEHISNEIAYNIEKWLNFKKVATFYCFIRKNTK